MNKIPGLLLNKKTEFYVIKHFFIGEEKCAQVQEDFLLNNVQCSEKLPIICQRNHVHHHQPVTKSTTVKTVNTVSTSTSIPCPNPSWIGDGECDIDNNLPSCDYDGGDCDNSGYDDPFGFDYDNEDDFGSLGDEIYFLG